jgi:transposase
LDSKSLVWHHDNARPHTSKLTKAYLKRNFQKTIFQAPYSPDLNIFDRYFFNVLKLHFKKLIFKDYKEVENEVGNFINSLDQMQIRRQIEKLIQHCKDVIEVNGGYIT